MCTGNFDKVSVCMSFALHHISGTTKEENITKKFMIDKKTKVLDNRLGGRLGVCVYRNPVHSPPQLLLFLFFFFILTFWQVFTREGPLFCIVWFLFCFLQGKNPDWKINLRNRQEAFPVKTYFCHQDILILSWKNGECHLQNKKTDNTEINGYLISSEICWGCIVLITSDLCFQ